MGLIRIVSGALILSNRTDIELLTSAVTKVRSSADSSHCMPVKSSQATIDKRSTSVSMLNGCSVFETLRVIYCI